MRIGGDSFPDFRSRAAARPVLIGSGDASNDDGNQPLGKTGRDRKTGPEDKAGAAGAKALGPSKLTADQEAEVADLRRRDAEVRAHEAAHAAAAGALGGGASFSYEIGPDGRNYAVGGEVPVQMAPGRTPEETIRNAQQLRAAALAPAEPSAQDRSVAAEASAIEAAARAQLAAQATAPTDEGDGDVPTLGPPSQTSTAGDAANASTPAGRAGGGMAAAHVKHQLRAPDHERMMRQLESEQQTTRAGWRHLHSDDGCASCRQAVQAYR